jgi:hypothetical protein
MMPGPIVWPVITRGIIRSVCDPKLLDSINIEAIVDDGHRVVADLGLRVSWEYVVAASRIKFSMSKAFKLRRGESSKSFEWLERAYK